MIAGMIRCFTSDLIIHILTIVTEQKKKGVIQKIPIRSQSMLMSYWSTIWGQFMHNEILTCIYLRGTCDFMLTRRRGRFTTIYAGTTMTLVISSLASLNDDEQWEKGFQLFLKGTKTFQKQFHTRMRVESKGEWSPALCEFAKCSCTW